MSTTKRRSAAERPAEAAAEPLDVLLVGPLAGRGGIDQYIQQQRQRLEGVDVSTYDVYYPPGDAGLAGLLQAALLTLWAMVRFPFRRRPDVVHVHASFRFSFYRAAPYVLLSALVWRRPVVLHVHGSSFDEFVATDSRPVAALQSAVFDACDRIVVLSPYWREVLSMRADEDKLVVLPNAVDPDEYDPEYGADPPRIVFVSTLDERKGVPELVEAIESLDVDREYRVDVAGSGPMADRVQALAERDDRVEYLGYVSEERKRALLDRASIYVLPTHAENLPIAMLEGMAGGNAVVSTPVGGIPDVIGRDDGVLVEPGDADALADALASLLAAPERVERMGRRNRESILDAYTWDVATSRLQRLYEDLARE